MADKFVFHIRQRDPHPAYLDVTVDPACKHDLAIRPVTAPVTGPKCADRICVGIVDRHEIRLGNGAILQIADRHIYAHRVDATDDADRAMAALIVEDEISIGW